MCYLHSYAFSPLVLQVHVEIEVEHYVGDVHDGDRDDPHWHHTQQRDRVLRERVEACLGGRNNDIDLQSMRSSRPQHSKWYLRLTFELSLPLPLAQTFLKFMGCPNPSFWIGTFGFVWTGHNRLT